MVAFFGVIILAAAVAAIFGNLNRQYCELKNIVNMATITQAPVNSVFARSVNIEDLMYYLNELQRITDNSANTCRIGTRASEEILD